MADGGYDDAQVHCFDPFVSDRDVDDVAFYRDRARAADGPALEVACGTGRVYLDLLADGLDVDGFDASASALATLRDRAEERGLEPTVWRADATGFAVDREYALAYSPYNSVQHLLGVEDRLALLESVHDALAPGGSFVFDAFVPSFDLICEGYGEWREERVEHEGTEHVLRRRSRVVDEVEGRMEERVELRTTGGEVVRETSFRLAFLPPQQVELLVRCSPFEDWHAAGGFDGRELADDVETQVWTLRKGE